MDEVVLVAVDDDGNGDDDDGDEADEEAASALTGAKGVLDRGAVVLLAPEEVEAVGGCAAGAEAEVVGSDGLVEEEAVERFAGVGVDVELVVGVGVEEEEEEAAGAEAVAVAGDVELDMIP